MLAAWDPGDVRAARRHRRRRPSTHHPRSPPPRARHLVLRLVSIDRKHLIDVELGRIPDLEVRKRPASVFVRELLPEEGNRLKRLSRKAVSEAKRERALIVWASATRMPVAQIAALVGTDESHMRKVI